MESAQPKCNKIEGIESFIDEYRREESLWNVLQPTYKDRNERQASFNRLALQFGMTGRLTIFMFIFIFVGHLLVSSLPWATQHQIKSCSSL